MTSQVSEEPFKCRQIPTVHDLNPGHVCYSCSDYLPVYHLSQKYLLLFIPEFLNDMNAEAMEHLPNCCNLTFEENCDRPRVIVGHVVQEPTARRR